jgi:hypothetical protein
VSGFLPLIRDDLGSNLGKDTGCCNRGFTKFLTILPYNVGKRPQIRLKLLSSIFIPIHCPHYLITGLKELELLLAS